MSSSHGASSPGSKAAALLLALCLAAPASARAAGYYLPDRGVRGFSRAGAFVASCDDPSCLWYNPANLAALRGTRVLLDAALVTSFARFERAPRVEDGRPVTYAPVENEAPPVVSPSLMFTTDATLESFGFGAGFFAPYASRSRYDADGPQRYTLIDNEGTSIGILAVGAAWSPHPRVRVGASFQSYLMRLQSTVTASAWPGVFGRPEDANLDLVMQGEAASAYNPSGNFGLWLKPHELLELAVSAQLPVSFSERGSVRVRMPSHVYFDDVVLDPPTPHARLNLDLPWIWRLALRHEHEGLWDLELALVHERWSTQQRINVEPEPTFVREVPGLGDLRIRGFEILNEGQDTLGLRLGGSFAPREQLRLRGGLGFESSAFEDATYSVFAADGHKLDFALGASAGANGVWVDLCYGLILNLDRDVKGSKLRQLNLMNEEGALVVADGHYESLFHVLGLGLRLEL